MYIINKREVGKTYESKAVDYLISNGFVILERNYRNRFGEINIIAKKDRTITFIEVKYRRNRSFGDALEAVDHRKQIRISRVAAAYLMSKIINMSTPCSFDVIVIYGDGVINHVKNAFEFRM